jgi:hypothetical protein
LAIETWWVVTLALAITWLRPLIGDKWFRAAEASFSRIARKKTAAVVGIFVGTIVIRLALFPLLPLVPPPGIHDEMAYLVQADMFAHGHLAYPPHPMAPFFETFYLTFSPTYSAMYPPAQAGVLALGQLLGSPWIGVLLSCAAMAAALLWMLQGWLPPQWALLGAVLITLRICLFTYWMNSYWGGALAACAAALVIGALPRIQHHKRLAGAVMCGIGMALLANSRPFEGFIFCLPVAAWLIIWLFRSWKMGLGIPVRSVLLPLFAALAATVAFALYYNWRVTGNPLGVPHVLYYKRYMTVPVFMWQKVMSARHFSNPQLNLFYGAWCHQQFNGTWLVAKRILWKKCVDFWSFYIGLFLSIPLLAFPWALKDRRTRLLLIQFAFCVLVLMGVTWFIPHYAAPMLGTFLVLLMQSLRHLRQWKFRGRPVGIGWSRATVVLALAMVPAWGIEIYQNDADAPAFDQWTFHDFNHADIVRQLQDEPGEQLVLVRYAPKHNIHQEWVYNRADIDHAKTVWARDIPGADLTPLFNYYPKRKVWVVEPDLSPPLLYTYDNRPKGAPPPPTD